MVNAVFEIKEDTILYYLPNFKENDILISNDFGKTFNSFGIDFIGTGAKKLILQVMAFTFVIIEEMFLGHS